MIPRPPRGVYGVCNVCSQVVTIAERDAGYPCPNYYVDYSPEAIANPTNEPWLPGYRFFLRQASQRVGRHNVHRKVREYAVQFKISVDGVLEWNGGIKPTESTMAIAEEIYFANRPGSNYYPGATD